MTLKDGELQMSGRQNINIEMLSGNKDRLEELRQFNGMTQKELVGRLINWFCDQDRMVQQLILGQIPRQYAQDIVRLVLERIEQGGDALVGEVPAETAQADEPTRQSNRR